VIHQLGHLTVLQLAHDLQELPVRDVRLPVIFAQTEHSALTRQAERPQPLVLLFGQVHEDGHGRVEF